MTNPRPAQETMTIDVPAVARMIYDLDPEWTWKNGVQVFTKFEALPAQRLSELSSAALGLAAFANYFERDIPLSGLVELFNRMNRFGATVDHES